VAWLTDDITHPVVAYLNLGISFIALGKRQQAIEILQAGSNLDGASVRDRGAHDQARSSAYLQLGALYVEQGKLQRALAIYREALSSLPGLPQQREVLYQRIGDVLGRLQQWDEAERHHRAALELQPNQVAAHLSYGITLARNVGVPSMRYELLGSISNIVSFILAEQPSLGGRDVVQASLATGARAGQRLPSLW